MIIEVVAVEMVTRVGCQGHMVGEDVVVARTTTVEVIVVAMRDMIRVMTIPDGIQLTRMVMKVGAVSQVLKSKTPLAGKLSQVAGEPVEVEVVVVVATVGVVELVVVRLVVGATEVVVAPIMGILGGVVALREVQHKVVGVLVEVEVEVAVAGALMVGIPGGVQAPREVRHSHKLTMDGLEVVAAGEVT